MLQMILRMHRWLSATFEKVCIYNKMAYLTVWLDELSTIFKCLSLRNALNVISAKCYLSPIDKFSRTVGCPILEHAHSRVTHPTRIIGIHCFARYSKYKKTAKTHTSAWSVHPKTYMLQHWNPSYKIHEEN